MDTSPRDKLDAVIFKAIPLASPWTSSWNHQSRPTINLRECAISLSADVPLWDSLIDFSHQGTKTSAEGVRLTIK
ncbi:hypothetical protein MJO28_008362 [Puccinia striiformis f. sp. tritici]|uniref:Uncharacterized protein n=1 Tax=Puccinia striiformis f. sp. tritici TaxID=168172 RepID=A0ACC0EBZ0_9BASI|nr:uncharacterized protein Pst134EA_031226 [Puccinia striiformis f. sp. tritici]KAH9445392.1 hypothetical protein Pst134EA_031226 [Puccinia striiformis f. sp. tritici]KAH9452718.1 hypothetical protein Pst134EB_016673 [Puccinia striiformis f. sp. tritici]KAI7949541.1 hypothetical protein MJO28_008362 [Puccinia striiformis f. sp. tritici]KAI9610215.1 hypothetical protein KEM48_002646 [Puccinia striiformis f. sp. tritici PST-130]